MISDTVLTLILEVLIAILAAITVILFTRLKMMARRIGELTALLDELKERRFNANETAPVLRSIIERLNEAAENVTVTAATLSRMEDAAALVATDLAESHARADAVEGGPHGAAADAASRTDLGEVET